MNHKYISFLLLILSSFQITKIINSVEITLSSSMADVTETAYQIKNNIVTLSSDEEYAITGSCS